MPRRTGSWRPQGEQVQGHQGYVAVLTAATPTTTRARASLQVYHMLAPARCGTPSSPQPVDVRLNTIMRDGADVGDVYIVPVSRGALPQ
ncbi:hypothetical protein BRADI_1g43883v3 [Brachypodium distachyon]|nr:hypothetical protein BRADI_1g43883v3 [Brachypodium distachyon]